MSGAPISLATPVEFAGPPPSEADVAVIGGGVIGVTSAIYLARRGLRVVLLEKGRIAGEQSSRNWGWIRAQGRDASEVPLAVEAQANWRALARETNEDIGLRTTGTAYIARDQKMFDDFAKWVPVGDANGLPSKMIGADELYRMIPEARAGWTGALWTPTDMHAEPARAVPALARLAAREGVRIVENCAVRGLDIAAGRIAGVVTEAGPIACQSAVVAGGAWSALLLRRHDVWVPQLSVRCTVAATEPMDTVFSGNGSDKSLAFRPRDDGGLTLAIPGYQELFIGPDAFRAVRAYLPQLMADPFGTKWRRPPPKGYPDAFSTPRRWALDGPSPFEACRVLDPKPNQKLVARMVRRFGEVFPDLPAPRIRAAWAGMIDTMPDVVPVVDRVAAIPGLVVATGMSGHGFGIGPGIGRVIADLVAGNAPGHDLSAFALGRFARRTEPKPGAGI